MKIHLVDCKLDIVKKKSVLPEITWPYHNFNPIFHRNNFKRHKI